jgi:hypothetical protein
MKTDFAAYLFSDPFSIQIKKILLKFCVRIRYQFREMKKKILLQFCFRGRFQFRIRRDVLSLERTATLFKIFKIGKIAQTYSGESITFYST